MEHELSHGKDVELKIWLSITSTALPGCPFVPRQGPWSLILDRLQPRIFPGAQNPAQEPAGAQNPAQERPGGKNPAQEPPGVQNPAQERPGNQNPAQEAPGHENPAQEAPGS